MCKIAYGQVITKINLKGVITNSHRKRRVLPVAEHDLNCKWARLFFIGKNFLTEIKVNK